MSLTEYAKAYMGLTESLEERFHRKVQLVTPSMVKNPFLKRSIERDLKTVYDRTVA